MVEQKGGRRGRRKRIVDDKEKGKNNATRNSVKQRSTLFSLSLFFLFTPTAELQTKRIGTKKTLEEKRTTAPYFFFSCRAASRSVTALSCASSPSTLAIVATEGPRFRSPSSLRLCTVIFFTNESSDTPLYMRA